MHLPRRPKARYPNPDIKIEIDHDDGDGRVPSLTFKSSRTDYSQAQKTKLVRRILSWRDLKPDRNGDRKLQRTKGCTENPQAHNGVRTAILQGSAYHPRYPHRPNGQRNNSKHTPNIQPTQKPIVNSPQQPIVPSPQQKPTPTQHTVPPPQQPPYPTSKLDSTHPYIALSGSCLSEASGYQDNIELQEHEYTVKSLSEWLSWLNRGQQHSLNSASA